MNPCSEGDARLSRERDGDGYKPNYPCFKTGYESRREPGRERGGIPAVAGQGWREEP